MDAYGNVGFEGGAYLFNVVQLQNRNNSNNHFWRTHSGAELGYVEEKDGHLSGYEFKWKTKKQELQKRDWKPIKILPFR